MSARRVAHVDPHAQRFSAAVTAVVLALAIILGPPAGLVFLALQTFVFAFGAVLGMQFQPYAVIYRRFVAPRRPASGASEPEHPARFGQAMGMLISVVALLAGTVGASFVFYLFAGAALAAAFLHAAFDYCVACHVYRRFGHIGAHADLTDRRRTNQDVTIG